jgi:DNA-binding MurR/RpiR family transcriptional regulator
MSTEIAPQTPDELLDRLRKTIDAMPKRLRQCAEFVAANPERIAVSTVAELAEGANVQPSAFMRFCQEVGFSGFSQMQRLFRDNYSQRWPDYRTRLRKLRAEESDSPQALLAEFAEAGRTSLENLTRTLREEDLMRAVDALAKARTIHLVGFRRAFPIASYLSYTLEKMEVPAILHSGIGNLSVRHVFAKSDAMIAISFAPYAQATVQLGEEAGEVGMQIVAMTDLVTSPLLRSHAIPLLVNEIDVDAFRTLSATMTLAMTLAVAVGARRSAG